MLTMFRLTTIRSLEEYLSQENNVDNLSDKGIIEENKLEEIEKSLKDTLNIFGDN